jgi:hypothetical protein
MDLFRNASVMDFEREIVPRTLQTPSSPITSKQQLLRKRLVMLHRSHQRYIKKKKESTRCRKLDADQDVSPSKKRPASNILLDQKQETQNYAWILRCWLLLIGRRAQDSPNSIVYSESERQ